MDISKFANPDNMLRPAPFWAINGEIANDEITHQMEEMLQVGLSGAFFHSRHGLITDYLGDEWFDAMNAALKVAAENDGYLWLYDEDLWPSGNAGGQVAAMKDEYRSALLLAYIVAPGQPQPDLTDDQEILHCYAIKSRKGTSLTDFSSVSLDRLEDAISSERLFVVRSYTPKIGWWGGESYANLLNPEATKDFISLTHDVYYKKLGHEFGKRIPGMFTDEPQIAFASNGIAWYAGIPDVYLEWTGRDFWSDLPFLFFQGPESRKVRLLIYRTINCQFLQAYSKPAFEWCDRHNLKYTGHFMNEDDFMGQIKSHSGGVMGHYRYQHVPGIDHLCRQLDICAGGMLLTVKQASSAARQLGRNRVLDEIFGVSRHTSTFADFKWLGDFDLVHGANFFVPHLSWYSAKGRRKRDYPPNWNYQQTYWKDLNPLNDYFARVAHSLTIGKADVDIVMLHPIESAIAEVRLGVEPRGKVDDNSWNVSYNIPEEDMTVARELDSQMRSALDAILTTGHDCDLGDEGFIEDLGSVDGDKFVIGNMCYSVVVVPPSSTWRPRTFELLNQFAANGGKVVILGELPCEIDCDDARDKWIELAMMDNVRIIACDAPAVQYAIDEIAPKSFELKDASGCSIADAYVQHRINDDEDIFFIVNSDRNNSKNCILTFSGAKDKQLIEWDPLEGTCCAAEAIEVGSDLRIEFTLPASGSVLFTLGQSASVYNAPQITQFTSSKEIIPLCGEYDFRRSEENVLVLDRISVSYDGGVSFEPEDMEHRVRKAVLNHFGTQAMLEWQPWVAVRKGLFDGKGGDIVLRYSFTSDVSSPKAFAVIEDVQKGRLFVNGNCIDVSNHSWQWDRSFGKVEIGDFIQQGENIIDFCAHYDFLTDIEQIYIVGDFGVAMMDPRRGKIIEEPKKLHTGSWTNQGYPFYVGRMTYITDFNLETLTSVRLRLLRPSGTLFKVRLNHEPVGSILWQPYEIELAPFAKLGENHLEIEVVSSLQNAWGPRHEKTGDDNLWCGPDAFEDEIKIREEMNLFSYGLLGGAELNIHREQAPVSKCHLTYERSLENVLFEDNEKLESRSVK